MYLLIVPKEIGLPFNAENRFVAESGLDVSMAAAVVAAQQAQFQQNTIRHVEAEGHAAFALKLSTTPIVSEQRFRPTRFVRRLGMPIFTPRVMSTSFSTPTPSPPPELHVIHTLNNSLFAKT